MKFARISLTAAALVVAVVGAFSFKGASRFLPGTLYTVNGTEHIGCSRTTGGNPCNINAYTVNGTQVLNGKSTGE